MMGALEMLTSPSIERQNRIREMNNYLESVASWEITLKEQPGDRESRVGVPRHRQSPEHEAHTYAALGQERPT
ncbi:hypothetical protein FRC08_016180 [Ceratobasidium sp. 394]|nr:hypothetical protein FRC08_016180 [Ceratobasidium sp. 394]